MRNIKMNNNTKFSIIIPVFNTEDYLKQCIESVINQTYSNFEIILINDGSTDFSGDICDFYAKKDPRIMVVHQKNKGHILARRIGIELAKGEYLLFLDSDDYWDSNLLESIFYYINEYDCDLIIFKYKRVLHGNVIEVQEQLFEHKMVFTDENKELIFKKIISTSSLNNLATKVVKRTIIDNQDYTDYANIKNGEDLLQSLPWLERANKILYLNIPFYNYRKVSTSITNKFSIDRIYDFSIVRRIVLEYLKKMGFDSDENLHLYYNFILNLFAKYIIDLINSNIEKHKKISTLSTLTKNNIYLEAIKIVNFSGVKIHKRIALIIFSKGYFKILFFYVKLLSLFKKNDKNSSKKIHDTID